MPLTKLRTSNLLSGSVDSGSLGPGSITGHIAATTADDADLILIYDDDASALRKMTRANFTAGLSTTLQGAYTAGRVVNASNGPIEVHRTSNSNATTELLRLSVSGSVNGTNAGPRLSFHVPYADESRVGASIDGIKSLTSENDSTSELRFSTSDNNENLDHQVTISSDGLAVAGRAVSVPDIGSAASAFHVATSGITNAFVVKNSNGYVGLGDTSPDHNLHISSTGDASIFIEADTDNTGEGDNAFIKLSQDNTIVQAIIGLVGFDNRDPEGVTYTGALANNFLLGNTTNYGLQLGTNDNVRMSIASTGEITKSAQPTFNAYRSTDQLNIADRGTIIFNAERFDVGSNYNTSTGVFTAPVTGKYLLTYSVDVKALDDDASYYWLHLITSNRNYYGPFVPVGQLLSSDGRMTFQNTVVADMDASDTAYLRLDRDGGVTQADIVGESSSSYSWFHGYLLG